MYPYDGLTYHDFASCTKSVMTTLIGIAADQGKIDLDAPVLSFFPNRQIANRTERKEHLTVRHLLSMSSGFKWNARDDEEYMSRLRESSDWVQYALDLPMLSEPGNVFVYNSANSHLLSAILTEATGMTALEFARANLFAPLGITDVNWRSDPKGYTRGWGDLSLLPLDAAKIGFLFLHQGQWEGKQIVSKKWVAEATSFKISRGNDQDYGYGWYIPLPEDEPFYFRAEGRCGQRILIVPSMDMVVVVTAYLDSSMDDVIPALEAAIVNLKAPLPENPAGAAEPARVVASLKQAPAPKTAALPAAAKAASGKTFVFQSGQVFESVRFGFNFPDKASLELKVADEEAPRVGEIGLDGAYRNSAGGIPWIARGSWLDERTLSIEFSEGPGLNNFTFKVTFAGDRIDFEFAPFPTMEGKVK